LKMKTKKSKLKMKKKCNKKLTKLKMKCMWKQRQIILEEELL